MLGQQGIWTLWGSAAYPRTQTDTQQRGDPRAHSHPQVLLSDDAED